MIAAAYADIAVADFEAVDELYRAVRICRDFSASAIANDQDRKVRIVRKHEESTRHGVETGLG